MRWSWAWRAQITAHLTLPIASHHRSRLIRPGAAGFLVGVEKRLDPADSGDRKIVVAEPPGADQSQARSSAGSPEWHSSQSITAARPGSSTIRLPRRKSPWTRARAGGRRRVQPQPAQPSLDRGQRLADLVERVLPQLAGRERGIPAARRHARDRPPSIEWIRASAVAQLGGQPLARAREGRRAAGRGAPPRCRRRSSIRKPALSRRPPAGSNASGVATGTPAAAAAMTRYSTSSGAKERRSGGIAPHHPARRPAPAFEAGRPRGRPRRGSGSARARLGREPRRTRRPRGRAAPPAQAAHGTVASESAA